VILPFLRKTVFTCQIAVVGNVQAECLYHGRALLEINDMILINVLGKKFLIFL
jgi:hypothetical protein